MSQHQEQLFSADRNSLTGSAGACNLSAARPRFKPVRIKDLLDRLESDEEDTEPHDSNSDSDTEDLQMLPADDESMCDDKKTLGSNDAKLSIASNTNHLEVPCNKILIDTIETNNIKKPSCKVSPENIHKCHPQNQLSSNDNVINNIVNTISAEKINLTQPPTNVLTDRQKSKHDTDLDVISQSGRKSYGKPEINQHFSSDNKLSEQQSNYNFPTNEPVENKYSKILPTIPSQNAIKSEDVHTDSRFQGTLVPTGIETPMKQISQISYRPNPCFSHKQILSTPQTKPLGNHVNSGVETPGVILSHWSHHNLFQSPCNSIALNTNNVGHFPQVEQNLFTPRHYPSDPNKPRKPLMEAQHLNVNKNASDCQNNQIRQHSSAVKHPSGLPRVIERSHDLPGRVYLNQHEFHNLEPRKLDNDENKFFQFSQENHLKYPIVLQKKSNSPRNGTNVNWQENSEKRNSHSNSYEKSHKPSEDQADYPAMTNQNHNHDSKISPNEFHSNEDRWEKKHPLEPSPELELRLQNNDSDLNHQSSSSRSSLPKTDDLKMNSQLSVTKEKQTSNEERDIIPRNVQISIAPDVFEANRGKVMVVKDVEYLVLGKLGQGMSGEVLRVQDMSSGELRAIKCVNLSRIDKETAQGCLEEVSMLHKLQAPCIITMNTYEIRGPMLYVVMEMGDTDLNRLLKSISKEKQLPLTMILYYWTEMLTAVKHIHDNGVIHSDLKPANFLLVRGRLKLIDFGIASSLNADMTSVVKNSSVGTLNYISPEAIMDIGGDGDSTNADNKYKINYKSDVWSLGCILYSLVYGQTPFQHIRAQWAKVNAITNSKSKIAFAPTENLIKCGYTAPPPFLVDVMRRCLQHDPRARPTVNQLLGISYVGCGCKPVSNLPKISPSILAKIKPALDENEWRQLIEILEIRK